MKVVVLVPDGYGRGGGIALYNRTLLACLCKIQQIDRVDAFALLAPEDEFEAPSKLRYFAGPSPGKVSYLALLARNLKVLRESSLLVCGHINLLPLAAIFAQLFKIPLILITHGAEVWERPAHWKGHWMWRAVDKVISVSEFTRDRLLNWADIEPDQVTVIHNAIDLTKYKSGPKPEYLLERYDLAQKKVIITVGRLDPDEQAKGFDQVLELLPKLLKSIPDIAYVIVGSGDDMQRLQEKARRMSVERNVVFTGWISEAEKPDYYRLADAYVMPGRLEGFGYVYLEALACGIPVVGSKIDGSRAALLDGELGELVDPNDSEELFDAIQRVLQKEKSIPDKLQYFSIKRYEQEISKAILGCIA